MHKMAYLVGLSAAASLNLKDQTFSCTNLIVSISEVQKYKLRDFNNMQKQMLGLPKIKSQGPMTPLTCVTFWSH